MSDGQQAPPSAKTLLSLAWPVVIARSAQVVVGFTDALMVSKLGEDALAAVTTGSLNAFFFFLLPMGTVFIVSSFSSQFFGKGDVTSARRYAWYGLLVAGIAGSISALITPLIPWSLTVFDYSESVRTQMAAYMGIRLFAGFAVVGLEAVGNFFQGMGNTRLPMLAQLFAMVVNVGLNWMLIFGNLGAPALGSAGAGWASLAATACAFLLLFICFLRGWGVPEPPPKPEEQDEAEATDDGARASSSPHDASAPVRNRFALDEFVRMVRFGLPSGLNWFFEFAAFSFFINVVVAGLGTTALAAMNTVIQISSMAFMPTFGIASAGAILVGQALGGGRPDHVRPAVRLTLIFACGWQVLAAVVYVIFPEALMSLFAEDTSHGETLVRIGAHMLRLSVLWQLSDAFATTMTEALRAAGDTTWPLYARLAIAWGIFVPSSLLIVRSFDGGPNGAIMCMVLYLSLLAAALTYRFFTDKWRDIGLTEL